MIFFFFSLKKIKKLINKHGILFPKTKLSNMAENTCFTHTQKYLLEF